MKRIVLVFLTFFLLLHTRANDSMYYTYGSQLVPLQAADIRLSKEVLTITLLNDGFAQVDVAYTLDNQGPARTITMGFEASAPYMGEDFSPNGVHPHISDFCVEVNGSPLSYHNAVVRLGAIENSQQLEILDTLQWRNPQELSFPRSDEIDFISALYNPQLDSIAKYAYAYYFDAHFEPGTNTVHHTYRYRVGIVVDEAFFLDYKLTPALRWQGGQIDDFTLIVRAENTFKHFFVFNNAFGDNPLWAIYGKGKQRQRKYDYEAFVEVDENGEEVYEPFVGYATEFALRNAEVRFHATNFRPEDELEIRSGDCATFHDFQDASRHFCYDPGRPYVSSFCVYDNPPIVARKVLSINRILRNLPFAARGYVFKDKQLKQYFSQQWWYMPDNTYQADVSKLLPQEQEFIYDVDHPRN